MKQQTGSVLLISLIFLVVLSVLGLTSVQTSILEERMAGNTRDKELAFQSAEATLRYAEKYIDDNIISTVNFDTDGSDGFYDRSYEHIWNTLTWDDDDSLEYTDFDASYKVKQPPRFVIQHVATSSSTISSVNLDNYGQGTGSGRIEIFLITARATGATNNSIVTLQTTYGKRL